MSLLREGARGRIVMAKSGGALAWNPNALRDHEPKLRRKASPRRGRGEGSTGLLGFRAFMSPTVRKAISKRTRYTIFARDRFTCRYCGREAGDVVLVVDHILPVALGGDNDPSNLITACHDCNAGKGARSPSSAVPTAEDRFRVERERAELESAADAVHGQRVARERLLAHVTALLCAAVRRDHFDQPTALIIARYVEQHGADVVVEWVHIASVRLRGYVSDQKFGRYVSGIRRRWLAQQEAVA